jgi:NAD/NADP transhydrogenase alpha subunit
VAATPKTVEQLIKLGLASRLNMTRVNCASFDDDSYRCGAPLA